MKNELKKQKRKHLLIIALVSFLPAILLLIFVGSTQDVNCEGLSSFECGRMKGNIQGEIFSFGLIPFLLAWFNYYIRTKKVTDIDADRVKMRKALIWSLVIAVVLSLVLLTGRM